ncbi:MAG: hypothetical protein ABIA74_06340 [bacterium]
MNFFKDKNFWLSFLQPYLISIYPAVMVAGGNLGQFYFSEFLIYICFLFVLILSVFSFLTFLYKDWNKSSLFLSLFLIFFYGFHHFANIYLIPVAIFTEKYFFKFQVRYSFIIAVSLLIYLFLKLFKIKKVHKVFARVLIFPLLIIYVWAFIQMGIFYKELNIEIKKWDSLQDQVYEKYFTNLNLDKNNKKLPDIYYIILDTYTSEKALKKYHDKDISWFTDNLKKKGFYIAQDSFCNYVCTEISLASSLNMIHHDNFPREMFYGFLHHQIKNNLIIKFLKNLNYKHVYIGYDIPLVIKDLNKRSLVNDIKDYFTASFYDMIRPFSFIPCVLGGWSLWYYHWTKLEAYRHRNTILNNLINLENVINIDGPKFVFTHIECPHAPYVFDENGDYVDVDPDMAYAAQTEFISRKIDKVLDLILDRNKNSVIILQGDHGLPITGTFAGGEIERFTDFDYEVKLVFPILNAYYFPFSDDKKNLYNNISPVNSFRILFNNYFGTRFELLREDSFIGPDNTGQLYKMNNFLT